MKKISLTQTWTDSTGKKIPVTELSDQHLLNIFTMLEKVVQKGVEAGKSLPPIRKELVRRKILCKEFALKGVRK